MPMQTMWFLVAVLYLLILESISLAAVPILLVLLRKSAASAMVFLALMIVESIVAALFAVSAFSAGFGPGAWLCVLSLLNIPILLLALVWLWIAGFRNLREDLLRLILCMVGGLLIVALQLMPILGAPTIPLACHLLNQHKAQSIIMALDMHKQDHGYYPSSLNSLVPEYISSIPYPACFALSIPPFRIKYSLDSRSHLLRNSSVGGMYIETYNIETGVWYLAPVF
jgi:hypothetical protein